MSIVTLNVGGQLFTTSLQTLTSDPRSYFFKRFSGDFCQSTLPDGSHFIDRNPRHFSTVLDYLRNGFCAVPTLQEDKLELAIEADFYGLEGLTPYLGGESLLLYSNIIKRSQNFAQDSGLREIIKSLQYFAYGEDGEFWALTELVGLVLEWRSADGCCTYSVSGRMRCVSSEDKRPVRNPAKEVSFERRINLRHSGQATTGYMVNHESKSSITTSQKSCQQ